MKRELKTGTWIVAVGLLLVLVTGATTTEDDPVQESMSLVAMSDERALQLPPLHQELRRVLIDERNRLEDLYADFEAETDSRWALEIQRKIRQVKVDSQVALLETQAEAARLEGRTGDVERLEQGIRRLKDPESAWGRDPVPIRVRTE